MKSPIVVHQRLSFLCKIGAEKSMGNNILLTGADDLLATHLSAFELGHNSSSTIYRVQPANERRAAEFLDFVAQQSGRVKKEINSRLHVVDTDAYPSQAEKVWHVDFSRFNRDSFMQFLTRLASMGVRELNLVISGHTNDADKSAIAERCKALNIRFRIFRCSLIAGASPVSHPEHDFLHFLDALYHLKDEIQNRVPEYFSYEPLRYLAPENAEINLIRAEDAAQLMANISWREDTLDRSYDIASPESVPFMEICERIESVYQLSLQPTEDEQELTAIDRLFQQQTGRFRKHLESAEPFAWEEAHQAAGVKLEAITLDTLLEDIYKQQEAAYSATLERVAALSLQPARSIEKNGHPLPYFTFGENGTPVVILNALGQGLFYWHPLIDVLMQQHKVIIWEPRGTVAPPPPFGLKEQVEDLEAILKQEGIASCHLVGWCTGPKVAVEYYLRSPQAVQSLVFLNTQFKCAGTAKELITSYERNIDPMFRGLEKNPGLAGSVMSSLQLNLGGGKLDLSAQDDSQKLAVEVLSRMNQNLKAHVMRPFESEVTTLNYARQVVDFWDYDSLAKASQVQAPVLFMTVEYDKIALPAMSKHAVKLFPKASLVEVQGASHYCLYDRPEFVAGLMEGFFESSAA